MPLPFDATLKDLVQARPHDFGAALGLHGPPPVTVLNVDLATVSAATDVVLGYGDPVQLAVDLNFQASRADDLSTRVLLYNALLHHRLRVPVQSAVVLLRPAADDPALTGRVRYSGQPRRGKMDFRFEVVRLWRRPVRQLLSGGLGTLPLALLGRLPGDASLDEALPDLLRRMDRRLVRETTPDEAAKLLTAAYFLTGLQMPRELALPVFRGLRAMRESDTYQATLDEGRVDAYHRILLRLGRSRFGPPSEAVETQLRAVPDLERLERMTDRILHAGSWQEVLETP